MRLLATLRAAVWMLRTATGARGDDRTRDRAQVQLGGLGWAFVFFVGLIIMGAILENLVLEQAVDPVITYAENMDQSSSESADGIAVLKQFRGLFTFMVLGIAGMFFISYSILASKGRL